MIGTKKWYDDDDNEFYAKQRVDVLLMRYHELRKVQAQVEKNPTRIRTEMLAGLQDEFDVQFTNYERNVLLKKLLPSK